MYNHCKQSILVAPLIVACICEGLTMVILDWVKSFASFILKSSSSQVGSIPIRFKKSQEALLCQVLGTWDDTSFWAEIKFSSWNCTISEQMAAIVFRCRYSLYFPKGNKTNIIVDTGIVMVLP